jgi:thiol-disulfide isomerase/thioredoxin
MKRFPALVILYSAACLLVTACAQKPGLEQMAAEPVVEVELSNMGPAPELTNSVWLNTNDKSLRLADLRGKVVLMEFWTFGCYNCKNVMPSLKEWHKNYNQQGLVIIGNHFPEFAYEADLNNLKDAIQKLEIPYAVAQDNDGKTWSAYHVRYWPTLYLIDKHGNLRYTHIGEGHYTETEAAIKALLAEATQ